MIREAIAANDVAQVEVYMSQPHKLWASGATDLEDMRAPFRVFRTANPSVVSFTEHWLEERPDSIYAMTARAMVLETIAWHFRGDKWVRETYQGVFGPFKNLLNEALTLSLNALDQDESFLPAADTLTRVATPLGQKELMFQAIDHIFTKQPNMETLSVAQNFISPGWNGTAAMNEYLCEIAAPLMPDGDVDPLRLCIVQFAFRFRDHRREEIRQWLQEDPNPVYDSFRILQIIAKDYPSDVEIEFARDYFVNGESTDTAAAERFDIYYRFRVGEPMAEHVWASAKTKAAKRMKEDPYDVKALATLLHENFVSFPRPEKPVSRFHEQKLSNDQILDYQARRLVVAPFEPSHWTELARSLERFARGGGALPTEHLFSTDDLYVNAVVYSNHNAEYLEWFIGRKLFQAQVLNDPNTPLWPGWAKFVPTVDRDAKIYCPFVRAFRFHKEAVEIVEGDVRMEDVTRWRSKIKSLRAWGACKREFETPLEDLLFEPVDVELMQFIDPGLH
ncbi:MAG: DUF4034 domain-containing protein [Arenibacterium sp.]